MTIRRVTDRRRLGAAIGAGPAGGADALEHQGRPAAAAGLDLLQLREPGLDAAGLVALVQQLIALGRNAGSILVNDRGRRTGGSRRGPSRNALQPFGRAANRALRVPYRVFDPQRRSSRRAARRSVPDGRNSSADRI